MRLPSPSEIEIIIASGASGQNMGDVDDPESTARFSLSGKRWAVLWIRGDFIDGTGDADCVLKLDSHHLPRGLLDVGTSTAKASPFNFRLWTFRDVGTDGNPMHWRVTREELELGNWTFTEDDELVFEWTNPNTQQWALEVALWDCSHAEA